MYVRGLHHAMRHDLHSRHMAGRILFRVAVTIDVFMAYLRTTCLNCMLIQRYTSHHLDIFSDS